MGIATKKVKCNFWIVRRLLHLGLSGLFFTSKYLSYESDTKIENICHFSFFSANVNLWREICYFMWQKYAYLYYHVTCFFTTHRHSILSWNSTLLCNFLHRDLKNMKSSACNLMTIFVKDVCCLKFCWNTSFLPSHSFCCVILILSIKDSRLKKQRKL